MPPLYYADRFTVPQFAHQGFFSDITAQAEAAGVTSDQYFDFAWNEATYKGGVYALPLDTDTRALWYNKGNVEEVGLDPEAPPTTTDELRTITEALTVRNASGAITRYGINPLYDQAWLYTWGFAFRGEFQDPETKRITFAHPNNIAAMEFIKVFVEEIGVEDGRHAGGLLWRRLRRPERHLLDWPSSHGLQRRLEGCPAEALQADTAYGVVPMPGPDGPAPHASWACGWARCIPQGSGRCRHCLRRPLLPLRPCRSGEVQQGHLSHPDRQSVAEDPYFSEDPLHAVFMDVLPVSHSRPPIPFGLKLWDLQVRAFRDEFRMASRPLSRP